MPERATLLQFTMPDDRLPMCRYSLSINGQHTGDMHARGMLAAMQQVHDAFRHDALAPVELVEVERLTD